MVQAKKITLGSKKTRSNILDHLSTVGLLARQPLIGFILFAVGILIFGAFGFSLRTQGPLIQADLPVANGLHKIALNSPSFVLPVMIFGSFLGREMVVMIGLALGLYFFYKRFWRELAMVVVGFGGAEVIFELTSGYFNRHRPVFPKPYWEVLNVPGFPSGHTISAVICYGLLAYLLVPKMPSAFWKAVVIVVSLLIMFMIGFSRVFVGDHYLSDVLAGYALGLAWAGLAYTLVELIFKKSSEQKERNV